MRKWHWPFIHSPSYRGGLLDEVITQVHPGKECLQLCLSWERVLFHGTALKPARRSRDVRLLQHQHDTQAVESPLALEAQSLSGN